MKTADIQVGEFYIRNSTSYGVGDLVKVHAVKQPRRTRDYWRGHRERHDGVLVEIFRVKKEDSGSYYLRSGYRDMSIPAHIKEHVPDPIAWRINLDKRIEEIKQLHAEQRKEREERKRVHREEIAPYLRARLELAGVKVYVSDHYTKVEMESSDLLKLLKSEQGG